jgi:hypothetical protein
MYYWFINEKWMTHKIFIWNPSHFSSFFVTKWSTRCGSKNHSPVLFKFILNWINILTSLNSSQPLTWKHKGYTLKTNFNYWVSFRLFNDALSAFVVMRQMRWEYVRRYAIVSILPCLISRYSHWGTPYDSRRLVDNPSEIKARKIRNTFMVYL